jgi:hypothetical protein
MQSLLPRQLFSETFGSGFGSGCSNVSLLQSSGITDITTDDPKERQKDSQFEKS